MRAHPSFWPPLQSMPRLGCSGSLPPVCAPPAPHPATSVIFTTYKPHLLLCLKPPSGSHHSQSKCQALPNTPNGSASSSRPPPQTHARPGATLPLPGQPSQPRSLEGIASLPLLSLCDLGHRGGCKFLPAHGPLWLPSQHSVQAEVIFDFGALSAAEECQLMRTGAPRRYLLNE